MIEDAAQAPNLTLAEEDLSPDKLYPEDLQTEELAPEQSRFQRLVSATKRVGHLATRGAQTAVVLAEVSPANEAIRLSAWGAGFAISQDPLLGAAAFGAATLGVEAGAATAAAPLLGTDRLGRISKYLNQKISKAQKDPEGTTFSQTTKIGTALMGGSVVAMALEKVENPEVSVAENRRFGLWTSTWLAGACAVGAAALSEGGELAVNNAKMAVGGAGIVAAGASVRWLKNRVNKFKETRTYQAYETVLAKKTRKYAQQQGLDEEEFAQALADPRTARSEVQTDGEAYEVPQLMSLGHIKWLNGDFYARRFPQEQQADTIRFFNNKLDIEPTEELQTALRSLAEKNGVLVFDYSEIDNDALGQIKTLLQDSGIATGEFEELGTQTYYAGKISLKRPHKERPAPIALIPAFEEMVSTGEYDKQRFSDGASLHRQVSPEVAATMGALYEEAFKVLNDHPCRQGLTPEEFQDIATHDNGISKIVYSHDGQVQSMCLLGEDLSQFEWLNPDFYEDQYPSEFSQQQIVYFPAIATDPSSQGQRNSQAMINLIGEICESGDNEILVAFDCCDINKGFLDKFIEEIINKTPQAAVHFSRIDEQHYGAFKLSLT